MFLVELEVFFKFNSVLKHCILSEHEDIGSSVTLGSERL